MLQLPELIRPVPHVQDICVTGSKHDAYAKNDWNLKLQKLLRTCFDRQQRILGICFGCQTMAIVLGGRVGEQLVPLPNQTPVPNHFLLDYIGGAFAQRQ